ncbi:GrpB family protein [Virgibacillus halodenitrificans]|nr:GrpB family protein [Virgibacillus halodenitrificans]
MQNEIILEKHNPDWSKLFNDLKIVLENQIGDLILCIEHVGSTSIEGICAKPIIDLDVVIDHKGLLPQIVEGLDTLGYYHEGDQGIEGREAFGRKDLFVPWNNRKNRWIEHHLYVCTKNNSELARHIAFRDYLRNHPEIAKEYEQLKKRLLRETNDRTSYTEAKGDFIENVLTET